jgi:glycosyltransferase involved in cell wall biosynthesis
VSGIKLSICIPTFNRAQYLRNALTNCATNFDLGFPFEIVVSDNASTDDTTQVVEEFIAQGMPIRYHRRPVNHGSLANLSCAFNHAVGEYLLYLADDDLLIADGLKEAVAYLDKNPDVSTCQTPWYFYDEVEDRDTSIFYHIEADRKFPKGSFSEVFQFMYERHIFPEIGVYRASALRAAWVPRGDFCFYAIVYLAHFLDQGAVSFLKKPFYRSVTVSKIAPARHQAGNREVMFAWDKYKGGLEYFIYMGIKRGNIRNNREARAAYEEKCKNFMLERMAIAIRSWVAHKDYLKAYELYTRMAIGGMQDHPEVAQIRASLPLNAALQTLVYEVNATAGIDRVILSDLADPRAIAEMLVESGLNRSVQVTLEPQVHEPSRLEKTVVFLGDAKQRSRYLALGYKPGLIFTDNDLVQYIVT